MMLSRKEDVDELISHFPLKRLHFIGTDMTVHYMSDAIDAMDDETFELFLKWHYILCERADCVGGSNHFLDIERKEGGRSIDSPDRLNC